MNHRYCQPRVSNNLLMIGAAAIMLHASAISAAEFIPLGSLYDPAPEDPASYSSIGSRISDDGTIVFGFTPGANRTPEFYPDVPFRWTRETGMQAIINDDVSQNLTAMSADGSTVVGSVNVFDGLIDWEHFVWTEDTGLLRLGVDQSLSAQGDSAISRDGSVVVGLNRDGGYRWTVENGFEAVDIPLGEIRVSPDGKVIAGEVSQILKDDGGEFLQWRRTPIFRWTEEGGVETIGEVPGHYHHSITGMSDDGTVLAGVSGAPPNGANYRNHTRSLWRWTQEEGLVVLADVGNDFTFRDNNTFPNEQWLSADGSVLVGNLLHIDTGSVSVYRWTEETGLQLLPGADGLATSIVRDMTPDGKWLAGFSAISINDERPWVPWLWSEDTGILNLLEIFETQGLGESIEGWSSFLGGRGARWVHISDDARAITGTGHNPDGLLEGWVAYLDPIPIPPPLVDFDGDGIVDVNDVDALVSGLAAGTNELLYDVSRDGLIDHVDLTEWLTHAATENGFAEPYLLGDANLDGTVNAADLNKLGQSWLASPNAWQWGDFNADGVVNAGDLDELAQNWLVSIPAAAAPESVPEPSGLSLTLMLAFLFAVKPFRNEA